MIFVEGRPVSLDSAEIVTEQLKELEQVLSNLKTMINRNKLIESQSLSL